MKFFLLSLILMGMSICLPAQAESIQTHLHGFEGLNWGASSQSIASYMRQFGVDSSCGQNCFKGGSFAGIPMDRWQFEFMDNGFYRVKLNSQGAGLRTRFNHLKKLLTRRYGPPACRQCDLNFEPIIYSYSWEFPVSPFSRHKVTLARSTYYHGETNIWLTFSNAVVERMQDPQFSQNQKRYFDKYSY